MTEPGMTESGMTESGMTESGMTEVDLRTVLADTFASREPLVAGAANGLVEGSRRRARQRRGATLAGVGALVVAAVAIPIALAQLTGSAPVVGATPTLLPPPTGEPSTGPGPGAGWRTESSLGVEIDVPASWAVNDTNCNQTDKPSVVRFIGGQDQCLTPEPQTKELAIIETGANEPSPPGLTGRPVSIGAVPATRAEGQLPDGRYAGWVELPGRDVQVVVRTHSQATTKRILDSVRLADIDHLGCPARRPAVTAPSHPASEGLVPATPDWITICGYGESADRLGTSARLTGAAATALASALNSAPAGRNPAPSTSQCIQVTPPAADTVLRVRGSDGTTTWVWVTFSQCRDRGLDNGLRTAQVSRTILQMIETPLHTGYVFSGDLPA